jgi:hypothetical protein
MYHDGIICSTDYQKEFKKGEKIQITNNTGQGTITKIETRCRMYTQHNKVVDEH